MLLWFVFAAMAVAAAGLLVWAFLRQPAAPGARADYELEVCRAQLLELDRDLERGVVTRDEVEAAKLEIQRRMLAADAGREAKAAAAASPLDRALPAVLGALLPLAALGIYAWLGSPGATGPAPGPVAERAAPGQAQSDLPDIQTMITRLKGRLAEQPQDIDGWITLGQTYMAIGRYPEAVDALDRALEIRDDLPFVNAARGEALVFAAEGRITPDARAAFEKTLETDPGEPRARFYLAMAAEQDGEPRKALEGLAALLSDAPPGADWAEAVRRRATALAEELGEDPAAVLPAAPVVAAAPVGAGSAADTATDPDELAAKLAENPKDYQGWIALARLRAAAGDAEGARAALQSGAEAYPGAPFVQQQFQQAAAELGLENGAGTPRGPTADDIQAAKTMSEDDQQAMIRGMVEGLAERLENEPDDIEGWRMLARSYDVLGEPKKAAEVHQRLIALLPEDAAPRIAYAEALIAAGNPTAPPPPEAVAALEQALELDAANPDALFHLGEAARRKGDATSAGLYWQRLLEQLPPGTDERAWLQKRIDGLPKAE
ncbi:MAG: c-type cytochrome biogenesis protein CcmI [Kiloniellales bacterium]|nr:c-type cytochrome biogenesis protein CcmI [Kiloniellales bacterium]